jgi:hypothetical protein
VSGLLRSHCTWDRFLHLPLFSCIWPVFLGSYSGAAKVCDPQSIFLHRLLIRDIPPINTSFWVVRMLVASRILARYFRGSQTFAAPCIADMWDRSSFRVEYEPLMWTELFYAWSTAWIIMIIAPRLLKIEFNIQ